MMVLIDILFSFPWLEYCFFNGLTIEEIEYFWGQNMKNLRKSTFNFS